MVTKALGEIALRTPQLQVMQDFYEHVVGLKSINTDGDIRFLKVGEGFAGHIQVIVLFDAALQPDHGDHTFARPDLRQTTLHHIALAIDVKDYQDEKQRIESLGYAVGTAVHRWVKWRALYINDPDGNTVEWVCYDASLDPE